MNSSLMSKGANGERQSAPLPREQRRYWAARGLWFKSSPCNQSFVPFNDFSILRNDPNWQILRICLSVVWLFKAPQFSLTRRARNRFHRRIRAWLWTILQGVASTEEPRQCKLASSRRRLGSAWTRFAFTSATVCFRDRQGHREASGRTAKTMSRRWPSYAAYKAWDSNSAKFGGYWIWEGVACSPARRYAADWKRNWPMYAGNLRTFRS